MWKLPKYENEFWINSNIIASNNSLIISNFLYFKYISVTINKTKLAGLHCLSNPWTEIFSSIVYSILIQFICGENILKVDN